MVTDKQFAQWSIQLLQDSYGTEEDSSSFFFDGPILRSCALHSDAQQQTSDTFGFKWKKRETFESESARKMMREWARERYGDPAKRLQRMDCPVVLDAGCGAAYTALEYFQPVLNDIRYLGVDISTAVDVARNRMTEAGANCAFIQSDLNTIPVRDESIDVIFSEGVLHHTDSTKNALGSLVPLLKKGGLIMFYVYRTKGPLREFTDDYIRDQMQSMSGEEGWNAMMPLTKLGETLGKLDIEINVDEPIDLLEIPAGKITLQRLFYWHVFKAFYRSDYDLEEMNHINFDWYAPRNAHRQTEEEVRAWCKEFGLEIEHEDIQEAGITIVARK